MTALEYRDGTGDWRERAACRDSDPDLWFPASDNLRYSDPRVLAAVRICRSCPVKAECLEEALANDMCGIWGGTTGRERTEIKHRAERGETQPPCGTKAAYARHQRRGEPTCDACRGAMRKAREEAS